jgi:hypothetical protein
MWLRVSPLRFGGKFRAARFPSYNLRMQTLQPALTLALVLLLSSGSGFADQVVLQSQEGQDFKVDVKVAKQSVTIKNLIDDAGVDAPLPLPNIPAKTLAQLLEFMKQEFERKRAIKPPQTLAELMHKLWEPLPTQDLIALVMSVNYLEIISQHESDVLFTVLKLYGDRIFSDKELAVLESKPRDYNAYVTDSLVLPAELRLIVVRQNLRNIDIDRIFLNDTKDRRIDAIENTPLHIAQIVAFIAKHKTPKPESLLAHFQTALKNWVGADKINETIHFGPMPTEFATWPAHCQLPGHPDYNMYSDDTPDERFVDNGDGTITDLCTLLMWEKAPSTPSLAWVPAKDHCAHLNKANHKDWRLPGRTEGQSIVNYTKAAPAMNAIFEGGGGLAWSSTPRAGDTYLAWGVLFYGGSVGGNGNRVGNDLRVRCAR